MAIRAEKHAAAFGHGLAVSYTHLGIPAKVEHDDIQFPLGSRQAVAVPTLIGGIAEMCIRDRAYLRLDGEVGDTRGQRLLLLNARRKAMLEEIHRAEKRLERLDGLRLSLRNHI